MFFINNELQTDERYDAAKFIEFLNEDNYDILNSFFMLEVKTLPEVGKYVVSAEEFDPALISFRIYGATQFWQLILIYNDILSFEDIVAGVILRYPSIDDMENVYFRLNALRQAQA